MQENSPERKKKRTITAIVSVSAVVIVIFLFLFSLFHLPERDPNSDPAWNENATVAETPAEDFGETNDIMSASQEQVSQMLGELEMQYENAKLNSEAPDAEQAGMRLALAYQKAGQTQNAIDLLNSLIQNYSYDTSFVDKCRELLKTLSSPTE